MSVVRTPFSFLWRTFFSLLSQQQLSQAASFLAGETKINFRGPADRQSSFSFSFGLQAGRLDQAHWINSASSTQGPFQPELLHFGRDQETKINQKAPTKINQKAPTTGIILYNFYSQLHSNNYNERGTHMQWKLYAHNTHMVFRRPNNKPKPRSFSWRRPNITNIAHLIAI